MPQTMPATAPVVAIETRPSRAAGAWLRIVFCRGGVTLAISALCLAAMASPFGHWLQYDREAIAAGQIWRLLTGHLAHWSTDHLAWDLLMFFVLGLWCEQVHRLRYVACLLAAALSISAGVWALLPQIASYRGLSGIDTALFMLLGVRLLKERWSQRDWPALRTVGLLMAGLLGKTIYEAATGRTLFVESLGAGFQPLVWSHILGAMAGALVAIMPAFNDS